jgi:hypothetical protein
MLRRLLACGVALGALTAGAAVSPAGAADAAKPLRVIVYDVTYAVTTTRREKTSGFTGNGMSASNGSPFVNNHFGGGDDGTVTVAIVAATLDGGLVADVGFVGKKTTQPTVRVAILRNGALSFDPHKELYPEASLLLPLLARGLMADRTIDVGQSWAMPAPEPVSGETTYKVAAVDGNRATLAFQTTLYKKAPPPYSESATGNVVYATDLLSPLTLDIHSIVRRPVQGDVDDTIDSWVTAKLRSDTFAKR